MATPPQRVLRVAGVPEHFNLPWTTAASSKEFAKKGVDLRWTPVPGGTGAMVQAVVSGDVDVAVALTEGIVSAVISHRGGTPLRYCGGYVASPLRWMVATGAGRGALASLADLRSLATGGAHIRVSVSRLGSGSHLMAFLLAQQCGWPLDKLSFVVHKDFRTMRTAVQEGSGAGAEGEGGGTPPPTADVFLWEWFMTRPYVDSGEVKVLGHLDSPWPCFGLLAREAWLARAGNRDLLVDAFAVAAESAARFVADADSSCELISAHFGLTLADAHSWLRSVRYSRSLAAPAPALSAVLRMLLSTGVVTQGPGAAAGEAGPSEAGYALGDIVDTRVSPLVLTVEGVEASAPSPRPPPRRHSGGRGEAGGGRRDMFTVDLPAEATGIGAAHMVASAAGGSIPGRPLPVSPSPTPSPVKTLAVEGAGKDSLVDAHAYIAWRQGKARALAAVMHHLAAYGGRDVSGSAVAQAPAIPLLESVALVQAAAKRDVQAIRPTQAAGGGLREEARPRPAWQSVLVEIGMEAVTKQSLSVIRDTTAVVALGGVEKIAAKLGCDLKKGLPEDKVQANRAAYGENRLPVKPARSLWDHLMDTFEDETLRILIFSAVCSMAFGFFVTNDDGKEEDIIQGVAILLSVAVVSSVQSFQNWSKDREFKSLAALRADRSIAVIRSGVEKSVSMFDVVVGDLVKLTAGDAIPCDGVLLKGFDCEVDQSSATGESEPVRKTDSGDFLMIGGTALCEGEGYMIVLAVGTSTRVGETIAALEEEEAKDTPLQEKLGELAGQIGRIGTAAGALTFSVLTLLWYLRDDPSKRYLDILQYFILGVAIVVVAVPEGLPLAVTISLAFSMRRMMADNNLVRELDSCETMGSATVICSDKTGTLTENRMSVTEAWLYGKYVQNMEGLAAAVATPGSASRLASAIACNSSADLGLTDDSGRVQFIRSPSECALLLMLSRWLNIEYTDVREGAGEPLARRPFRKDLKFMTTIVKGEAGSAPLLYISGAPEVILSMCGHQVDAQGDEHPIKGEKMYHLKAQVQAMAAKGLRTLAVAFKRLPPATATMTPAKLQEALMTGTPGTYEAGAGLMGLFGLQDPLREGVPEAVLQCKAAGIRVIMVTGDHPDTARHIAGQCGIHAPGSVVLEGSEFRAMTPAQKQEAARHISVMARCLPLDKLDLVKTLQGLNEIVAVTGDGTNDAPALRAADVGLAMGIAGTEVAKEASDIIIMDDRFSSIVASVRWGRSIKENIRKFLSFQLTINIVALTLTFVSACTSGGRSELPLKPVQLLWVNLIMDSLAALALATEPPSDRLMSQRPQGKEESLITRTMFKNMIGHAIYQTALLLWMTQVPASAAFFDMKATDLGSTKHDTVVFTAFVSLQVFNLFNCRTVHDQWNVLEDFGGSVIAQAILIAIVVMQVIIVQFGGEIMQTVPLTQHQWAVCSLIGFSSVPVGFLLKLVPACEAELMKITPDEMDEDAGRSAETAELQAGHLAVEGAAFTADSASQLKDAATKVKPRKRQA